MTERRNATNGKSRDLTDEIGIGPHDRLPDAPVLVVDVDVLAVLLSDRDEWHDGLLSVSQFATCPS